VARVLSSVVQRWDRREEEREREGRKEEGLIIVLSSVLFYSILSLRLI
jgi:hypothetical protein